MLSLDGGTHSCGFEHSLHPGAVSLAQASPATPKVPGTQLSTGTHPTASKLKGLILLPTVALPLISLILIHDTTVHSISKPEDWESCKTLFPSLSQPATANQEPSVPPLPGQLLGSIPLRGELTPPLRPPFPWYLIMPLCHLPLQCPHSHTASEFLSPEPMCRGASPSGTFMP